MIAFNYSNTARSRLNFKIAGFSLFKFSYVLPHTVYIAQRTRRSPFDGRAATSMHKIQCSFRFSQEMANFMYGMHNMIVGDVSAANNATNR